MVLLIVDRLIKQGAVTQPIKTIGQSFFSFGFSLNSQGIFSLPLSNWWLVIFNLLIIVGLLVGLLKIWPLDRTWLTAGLLFLLVGGLSNFYDRLFWAGVVDYWHWFNFFSFNLADVYLIIGLSCLLRGIKQPYGS
ncbi:signal peptidase II [Patescibacteria group bacterium]|nr:signal peptidase II [Patescibacteria group bacterium]